MNEKTIIATPQAPQAIGPYSQAVLFGNLLFCSGQIALDPESGRLTGQTAAEQTQRTMENIGGLLRAAGLDFSNVLKVVIYLKDLDEYQEVNEVYARYFPNNPPARAAVQVDRLPKDAKLEIDVIAGR
ncbi:MAG: RidA family protein [Myxococcales bacterium]|nr:MAG: RidA family protein [Myxococcales bacterium]